ncbi:MAG TPA: TlpA disulfide reductase family protein [Bacteroidales bacterium]|nr:TlpA disulfide reductase family protein [Bacteroidales bacterium]
MRKLFYLSILVAFISSCSQDGGNKYAIQGDIKNLDDQLVYLEKMGEKDFVVLDSVKSTEGKFSFEGEIDIPMQHYITFEDLDAEITFFNEPSEITVAGSVDSLQKIKVDGSASQDLFETYQTRLTQIRNQQRDIYYKYQEAKASGEEEQMMFYENQYRSLDSIRSSYSDKFIKDHPGSSVAGYVAMRFSYTYELEKLKEVVSGFDASISDSYYVEQLNERIAKLESTAIGNKAPEFTMENVDGEPVSLSDLQGQYVLLDFWAAWCSPCRAENPNVVEAYQKYKDKGFTVLGVSLDRKRDDWLKAIEKDNLTWTHLSDLKGWENEASNLYGVMSIPANYLLDKEGVIVAKNLRGEALHEKLDELLN